MILITGAKGQLGTDLIKLLSKAKIEFIATDVEELDITNKSAIEKFILGNSIDLIINCAAYNNVDKAETEKEMAYELNCNAPKYLAEISKKLDAVFVTYSTDFVFDGLTESPYTEQDTPNPLSIYGQSKFDGEKAVLDTYEKAYVVRTSWVFGIGNKNFNTQVINWSKNNSELKIVDDQISAPTYSYDLAYFTLKLIKTDKFGLYHFSNEGIASKYDQAKYLLEKINWQGILKRAKTKDFNLPAKRPKFSKLDSSKIKSLVNEIIPNWRSGIDRFLTELNSKGGF